MFKGLDITGEAGYIEVSDMTEDGRWITTSNWSVLYPEHMLSLNESLASSGVYMREETSTGEQRLVRAGSYVSEEKVKALHETIERVRNRFKDEYFMIKRKSFYGYPLTIDFRPDYYRQILKCYIMEQAHDVIDTAEKANILVRKRYLDKIQKVYRHASVTAYGAGPLDPVALTSYTYSANEQSIVGILMPVRYKVNPSVFASGEQSQKAYNEQESIKEENSQFEKTMEAGG